MRASAFVSPASSEKERQFRTVLGMAFARLVPLLALLVTASCASLDTASAPATRRARTAGTGGAGGAGYENTYTAKCGQPSAPVFCRPPPTGEEVTMPEVPRPTPPKPAPPTTQPTPAPRWYDRLWPWGAAAMKDSKTPKEDTAPATEQNSPQEAAQAPAPRQEIIMRWGGPDAVPETKPKSTPPAQEPKAPQVEAGKGKQKVPKWKQECIDNYYYCQQYKWKGNCYDCLRLCEGQRRWPVDKCRP